MKPDDKKYYQQLAAQLMFELSDEEAEEVKEEFTYLLQQLELLDKIDTEGIAEMVYPFEAETSFIREDEIGEYLRQDEALRNAAKVKNGMVLVPKVVKE